MKGLKVESSTAPVAFLFRILVQLVVSLLEGRPLEVKVKGGCQAKGDDKQQDTHDL